MAVGEHAQRQTDTLHDGRWQCGCFPLRVPEAYKWLEILCMYKWLTAATTAW